MPRASGIKQLISPAGGLVTEQSKLTPVEGSSVSEVNMSFNDDGSMRQRRLGVNKEADSSFFLLEDDVTTANAVSYALWTAVNGDGTLNYHVFQIAETLYFIEDDSGNLTDLVKDFTFDLNQIKASAFTTVDDSPVSMVSGEGALFVVGQKIEPVYIEYDVDTDTISSTNVGITIRDLTGLDDELDIDERPATLSDEHDYNLNNQGWWQQRRIVAAGSFVDPIAQFFTTNSAYPSNADIAFLGMVDDGSGNLVYDADYILDLTVGNTPSSKGHFLIDPFNIDYESLRTGTGGSGGFYGGGGAGLGYGGTAYVYVPSSDPDWWEEDLPPAEGDHE